jgi:hypothetical protein
MLTNRHPADRLHDLRDEIRRLQAEVDQLRAELMAAGADLRGDEWIATVCTRAHRRIDMDAALAALGEALWPFLRRSTHREVRLCRRRKDGQ